MFLTLVVKHFIFIADAMTYRGNGEDEFSLWNEEDGMYYDAIQFDNGHSMQLPVRSLVGLIPLYATLVLEPHTINRFPGFKKRMEWFMDNRPEMSERNMANMKGVFFHIPHKASIDLMVVYSERTRRASFAGPCEQRTARQDTREDARRGRILERARYPVVSSLVLVAGILRY